MEDVVAILVDEVRELARLGATLPPARRAALPAADRPDVARVLRGARLAGRRVALATAIELDNAVIDAAPGVTFGFHLCRGNQDSRWLVSGGYEAIARADLRRRSTPQRLLLEYDDERSGGFDPLALVPDDKQVVLGLVTTKGPRPETEDELEARVREAARGRRPRAPRRRARSAASPPRSSATR